MISIFTLVIAVMASTFIGWFAGLSVYNAMQYEKGYNDAKEYYEQLLEFNRRLTEYREEDSLSKGQNKGGTNNE